MLLENQFNKHEYQEASSGDKALDLSLGILPIYLKYKLIDTKDIPVKKVLLIRDG